MNARTSSLDTLETRVVIDNEGMALEDQGGTVIADYGTSIRIGRSGQGRVEIFDTGIDIYDGQATPRKRVAIDADGKAAFGGAAGADVATNSTDDVVRIEPGSGVKIYDNADDYVHLSDAGMTVYEGGNDIAVFAATTRLGDIANDTTRLELSSGDVKFIHRANNNDTGSLTMKADGTIECLDYLIEKTRLFGSGGMGSIILWGSGTSAQPTASFGPNGISGNINGGHVYSDASTTANIDRVIHKHTDNTITSLDKLIIDLQRVRKKGYSLNEAETFDYVYGVGAPIIDSQNRAIAAISISGTKGSINIKTIEQLSKDVTLTAKLISDKLKDN